VAPLPLPLLLFFDLDLLPLSPQLLGVLLSTDISTIAMSMG